MINLKYIVFLSSVDPLNVCHSPAHMIDQQNEDTAPGAGSLSSAAEETHKRNSTPRILYKIRQSFVPPGWVSACLLSCWFEGRSREVKSGTAPGCVTPVCGHIGLKYAGKHAKYKGAHFHSVSFLTTATPMEHHQPLDSPFQFCQAILCWKRVLP